MASKWIYLVNPLLALFFSPLRSSQIILVVEQLKSSDIRKILALRLILKCNFCPGPQSPGLGSSRLEQGLLNIKVTKETKFCFSSKFRLTTHCWLVSIEMREMWVFWQRNLRILLKQCLFRKTVSVSCPSGVAENSSCCCRWHCCNSVLTFHFSICVLWPNVFHPDCLFKPGITPTQAAPLRLIFLVYPLSLLTPNKYQRREKTIENSSNRTPVLSVYVQSL